MAELKALEELQRLQIHLKKLRELKQLKAEMDSLNELKSRVATVHGKHLGWKQPLLGSGSRVEFKYMLFWKHCLISELLCEVFLISLKYRCMHGMLL